MASFLWIWFGFGSSIAMVFLRHSDLTSWQPFRHAEQTWGTVERCWKTHASEGGRNHSGTSVRPQPDVGESALLLFELERPENAVLLAHLDVVPTSNGEDDIEPGSTLAMLGRLVPPTIAVAAHAVAALGLSRLGG